MKVFQVVPEGPVNGRGKIIVPIDQGGFLQNILYPFDKLVIRSVNDTLPYRGGTSNQQQED